MTKGRRKLILIAVCFALADAALAAVIGVGVWRSRAANGADARDAQAQSVAVREEAQALALGEAIGLVTLDSEPQRDGNEIAIRLSNHGDSPYSVALELIDLQTQFVLATTGRIDPGYCLETLQLDNLLPNEAALCLARLHVYRLDTGAYLGAAAKQVLLKAD